VHHGAQPPCRYDVRPNAIDDDRAESGAFVIIERLLRIPRDRRQFNGNVNLAAMLKAAQAQGSNGGMLAPLGSWEDVRSPNTDDLVQIMLVAGARNPLNLEFAWAVA
jgi:hypothetical protein